MVHALVTQMQEREKDDKEKHYQRMNENQKKDEKKLITITLPVSSFKMKAIHDENRKDKEYFDKLQERIADNKVVETLGMHKHFDTIF